MSVKYTPRKDFLYNVARMRRGNENVVIYNGPDGPVYYKDVWTKGKKRRKSKSRKGSYNKRRKVVA